MGELGAAAGAGGQTRREGDQTGPVEVGSRGEIEETASVPGPLNQSQEAPVTNPREPSNAVMFRVY